MISSISAPAQMRKANFANLSNLRIRSINFPKNVEVRVFKLPQFDRASCKVLRHRRCFAAQKLSQIVDDEDLFSPRFRESTEIVKNIRKIDQAAGFIKATRISDQWIKKMQSRALILEAHYTTHIEGTELSLHQSERILSGKGAQNVRSDDVRELLNYKTAFERVAQSIDARYPLTEIFIREMHSLLVADVRGNCATPGEYRKIQNYVSNAETEEVVYTPPSAYQVPYLMSKLVQWINEEERLHPVLVAAIAQFQLVHIHPFLDGNGRVARLLSTLCLYRSSYDFKQLFTISEYYDKNRTAYYKALQDVRDNGMDLTGWLEYFTVGLSSQMSDVESKCEELLNLELGKSLDKISDSQKRSLESLNFRIGEIINRYISFRPFVDREKLKNEIFSVVEADL